MRREAPALTLQDATGRKELGHSLQKSAALEFLYAFFSETLVQVTVTFIPSGSAMTIPRKRSPFPSSPRICGAPLMPVAGSTPAAPHERADRDRAEGTQGARVDARSAEPAGQAPAGAPPVTYAEPPRPAVAPAPAVNVGPLEEIRRQWLAEIEAKVQRRRAVKAELAEQQRNSAALIEQMKLDEMKLAGESEALEAEVGAIQRELAAAEAQQLATQAVRDQAARGEIERLPLKAWQARFREELIPLVTRIVSGLVKLRAILTDKGATLEQVAALRSPTGLDGNTRSEFIAVSVGAQQILGDLHDRILAHERALAHAEDFLPDPGSPDGKSAINGLRRELENVSGMITGRLVDRNATQSAARSRLSPSRVRPRWRCKSLSTTGS